MPEPTFGHQPGSRACETCGKPTDADDFYFCNPCFDALPDSVVPRSRRYVLTPAGVEAFRRMTQPDDPGTYARSCLRCGLDEGLGENRLCARCCPPAPWWAGMLRWLPCVARRWFA